MHKGFCPLLRSFFWKNVGTLLVIAQFHNSLFLNLRLHIILGVIKVVFKGILAGFLWSQEIQYLWLVMVLVETETGQSTGSCMHVMPSKLENALPLFI